MLPEMQQPGTPYLRPEKFVAWYALDYFQRPNWRQCWKWMCCVLAFDLSIAWLGYLLVCWDKPALAAGPVSTIHAREQVQCGQCHTGWFRPAARLLLPEARSVRDADCAGCHAEPAQKPYHTPHAEDRACATCHREHRGQMLLKQVKDAYCIECHADPRLAEGSPSQLPNVADFLKDHPEFAAVQNGTDACQLRFNHAVHLRSTGVLGPGGIVQQLGCSDCHQLAGDGKHMTMPKYESCRDCHPLSVAVLGDFKAEPLAAAVAAFNALPATHVEPALVRQELRQRYTAFVQANPSALNIPLHPTPKQPLPGKPPSSAKSLTATAWVQEQVQAAERRLLVGAGGCRYCHEPSKNFVADSVQGRLPSYAKTNLSQSWMPRAVFNHAVSGHKEQDCTACHPATYSTRTQDVLMPGIESCRVCHQPAGSGRFDCSECHRYHHADQRRGPYLTTPASTPLLKANHP
jgi:predicted CXXCH cytochrome family protein